MRAALLLMVGLLSGCAVYGPPSGRAPEEEPRDAWARVLLQRVDPQGRVDFAGLARDRADLDRTVAWIYAVSPDNRPDLFPTPQHVLAYHLNAYNALAMYAVLESGIPETNAGFGKVRFFFLRRVEVGGRRLNLRAYENEVIRPLGDPRVHFALNCMSVGCPRLPREPFRAETLDAQLERAAREFFAEERNARVDVASRKVYLSEILDFFPEDFLAVAPSLILFANRYRQSPLPEGYTLDFTPYDWAINRQPRAP
ncbi:MAG: DUF547 domain-containing protein [Burkholderiales bacterium]